MGLQYRLLILAVIAGLACVPAGRKYGPAREKVNIQAYIDAARDGQELVIPYGTYTLEQGLKLTGRRNFTITAQPGTRILVDDVMEDVISIESSDSIRIENLCLRHVEPLKEYECHGACIRFNGCRNVVVENCELNGCGAFGVAADNTDDLLVRGCYIHHNSFTALYLSDCNRVTVVNNRIVDNAELTSEYGTSDLIMEDNQLK